MTYSDTSSGVVTKVRKYLLGVNKNQVKRLYTLPLEKGNILGRLSEPNYQRMRERTRIRIGRR